MRNRLIGICIVLLALVLLSHAQVQNSHNIVGVGREVASSTSGSYGMILKWDPATGRWTAQEDSIGFDVDLSDTTDWNNAALWVASDSSGVNLLYIWVDGDSVKINNLRIWAESDSANYNLAYVHSQTAHDSIFFSDATIAIADINQLSVRLGEKLAVLALVDSLTGLHTWARDDSTNYNTAFTNNHSPTAHDSLNITDASIAYDDLSIAGAAYGKILKWNPTTSKWSAQADSATAIGTIDSTVVADGDLAIADVAALLTRLGEKLAASAFSDSLDNPHGITLTSSGLQADSTHTISYGTPWDLTDGQYVGKTVLGQAAVALVFGEVCYMTSAGKYHRADADSTGTMSARVMALASISADAYGLFLQEGYVCESSWTTVQTVGVDVYVSATPGVATTVQPAGSGDQSQKIGYCIGTDIMYFEPDQTIVEVP